MAQLLALEETTDLVLHQNHGDGVAGEHRRQNFQCLVGCVGHQQKLRQIKGVAPMDDGAQQAAAGEEDQRAVAAQGAQGAEETLRLMTVVALGRRNADHQEQAAKGNGAGDQKRCPRQLAGNHYAQHRTRGIADIGQGVAQGKHLGALTHRQVFADDRLGADQEQRRRGFSHNKGQRGEVEVAGKGQQQKTDGAGEHGQDQQLALFQTVDDVAAVQTQERGDEHGDPHQQADVLLVEAQACAQPKGQQWAGHGTADHDGHRADHQATDYQGVGGHGGVGSL